MNVAHSSSPYGNKSPSAYSRTLLQAISGQGQSSVDAYRKWREITDIDIADGRVFSVLPLLADLLSNEKLDDPDLPRMRGVSRQIWAGNTLKMRLLFRALDCLKQGNIEPVLLKGAALFARAPGLIGKRAVGDYDLLISPDDIAKAVNLLRADGFVPNSLVWSQFDETLFESVAAGMPISHPEHDGEVDIHWRPLWNNHSAQLLQETFARAEPRSLHGRAVRVLDATNQLFFAMARCDPADEKESFARLVEAWLLIGRTDVSLEWDRLASQAIRFGLTRQAEWFFQNLQACTGLLVPPSFFQHILSQGDELEALEWQTLPIDSGRRTEQQKRIGRLADHQFGRAGPSALPPPSEQEATLRDAPDTEWHLREIWQLAADRVVAPSGEHIEFLEGWSSPEADGRWSDGKWAVLSIPVSGRPKSGTIRLFGTLFDEGSNRRRFYACGGEAVVSKRLSGKATAVNVKIPVRILPGTNVALVLLYTPDADVGPSGDPRVLGFFAPDVWSSPTRQSVKARAIGTARQLYHSLPISPKLRLQVGPTALALTQRVLGSRSPLPAIDEIAPGNVVVSGFLSDATGIGKAGRLTLEAMRSWNVPVFEHDLRLDAAGRSVKAGENGIWICHCNPPQALAFMLESPSAFWTRRYRIGIWAYELPRLPSFWLPALRRFHEIWAPSEFVADAIRAERIPGLKVRVVPHPVRVPWPPVPERAAPANRPFQFLAMFDLRSSLARKNPEGAIAAFQKAFTPESDVRLLLKGHGAEGRTAELDALRQRIEGWPNISLLVEKLSDQQTLELVRSADCLVSLHRSEGFGLVIAEAMSVGTPVIATDWSAPAEFMHDAALPVRYDLVPATDSSGRYDDARQLWAEPDLDAAAKAMHHIATDPDTWLRLSRAGPRLVETRLQNWVLPETYSRFLKTRA